MKYCVNLITGDVTTMPDGIAVKSPSKYFKNEHQAGYMALGICLQNIGEKATRLDISENIIDIDFLMLGATHTVNKAQAIKGRAKLQADYPECFI